MNNSSHLPPSSKEKKESAALPREPIHRLTGPIARFLRIEAAGGLVLLAFTLVALIFSNSPLAPQFRRVWETSVGAHIGGLNASRSVRGWIDDGLMTSFFFLVALELKRELVLGELRNVRVAILSVMGALGGMLVPGALYLILQFGKPGQHGWGAVMATDTAFVIGCLALLGKRVPPSLRVLMLSSAIVDDIGAIVVVAIAYGDNIRWEMIGLAAAALGLIRGMSSIGIRSIAIYFLLGVMTWMLVDASGIHATLTGVILGLMTPAHPWVSDERLQLILRRVAAYAPGEHWSGDTEDRKALRMAESATRETLSPIERLEMKLHPWVGFVVLPLFALANAGISITFRDVAGGVPVAVFLGLTLGKPIGIMSFAWLSVRAGFATRPQGLDWTAILGGALLSGIGFTMALFITNLAFPAELIPSAKLGIFGASIFSAVVGVTFLAIRSRVWNETSLTTAS